MAGWCVCAGVVVVDIGVGGCGWYACCAVQGGRTALMWAGRWGKVRAMAMLLDRGADLEAKDNVWQSYLATEQWRLRSLSGILLPQTRDCALGHCFSQAGKSAIDLSKAEHFKALVPQILGTMRRDRERERTRFAEALAAKQTEIEEAQASCAKALAAKQAELEVLRAAKQAEVDAQAVAAEAYRSATVAAMAALGQRVKQLEGLAQLLWRSHSTATTCPPGQVPS